LTSQNAPLGRQTGGDAIEGGAIGKQRVQQHQIATFAHLHDVERGIVGGHWRGLITKIEIGQDRQPVTLLLCAQRRAQRSGDNGPRRTAKKNVPGEISMASAVNTGVRLDRLPISFVSLSHLLANRAGMFFDGYDLYVALPCWVLRYSRSSPCSPSPAVHFLDLRRHDHRFGDRRLPGRSLRGGASPTSSNLIVFGLASFAAAAAPSMDWLIAARFVMGLGLGAEIVVGYSTMTEFVPRPRAAAGWPSWPLSWSPAFRRRRIISTLIIPSFGWRPMFVIAGVGALIVWYLRKKLPESPALARDQWQGGRSGSADAGNRARGLGWQAPAGTGTCVRHPIGRSPRCSVPPCCRGWSSAASC